ncbi:TPA: fimbrial biogenesis outer membrane usher protein, partial [Klebsiella variicola]|nr:fimbrial biogenesis outer membrane usher protein [Klebsiella variicola]
MSHRKYGLDHWGCRSARRLITPALTLWLCSQPFAARADLYFNPRFLADDPAAVADLSGFEKGQEVPPGTYRVDIYLNNGFMTTRDVTFQADAQGHGLSPCLTRGQLASMGVDTGRVPGMATLDSAACVPLTTLISEATTRFDVGQQRLYLTVPQAFMGTRARGYIPPELWDNGITAGLINYNFTGNNVHNTTGGSSRYAYLNMQSGLNVGAWRLRDNSTWSYSSGSGSASSSENRWQHVNSWLERDITPLRSRLTLGDSYTNGDVFDGINFRGAQLASDDNMLPDSQKGFAPVIHGIARGTAQVSIKQNGYEIYQSTVPPGPFTIDDLYAAGNGGDLQVTIKEADGSRQVFSVPWSTVPVLQREGHTRFALTAGEYRSGNSQQETPDFFQSTAMHGLPAGWTLYGGTQLADRYRAFNLGVGKNMGYFGALSLDITQANATLADDSEHQGQSVRFLYNKSLDETGTNLQLVGYRYSTRGYYNFADTTYRRMSGYSVETQDGVIQVKPKFTDYYNLAYSKRGKVQLSVTQQLGRTATLYLSGSHQTYWGTDDADEQLQAGLNAAVDDINWSLSYSLTKNAWQQGRDQMLAVNVNIPFSHWLRSDSRSVWRHASASYSLSHDLNGRMTNLAGLYGTLLEDNNLSYSVQTGYAGGGNGDSGSTGYTALNYRGGYGNANVGYSRSDGFKQLYYGVSGGVLAHANGITLSQPLNDTVVLVKAPGA